MWNPKLLNTPQDVKDLKRYTEIMNKNLLDLSRSMQSGTTYIVIGGTSGSSSGGGSGATPTSGYRAGIQALTTGTTTVSFSSTLTQPYVLIIEIYNSDGILMPQPTIDSNIPKTTSGFTVTTSEDVTIRYMAVSTV